jgi:hypothetical protein
MAVDVRSQACSYLRNGKVTVCVAGPDNFRPPEWVRARVAGQSSTYFVRLADGVWRCSCEETGCPHVAAVQHCTGHDGMARKPGERER